ncbi:MAG: DNA polymerase III subunit beta [Fimbriimonadales bacterium]
MQITCPRKDLLEAAQFVGQGVSARSTLPILSNVWLAAEDDGIALMSSDLEMWVRRSLPSVPGEMGATTVPARMFTEILSALPDGDAQITIGERNEIEVRSGSARYTLMGLSADEFPPMPEFAPDATMSISLGLLKDMFDQVSIAVSKDEARPALTGVLFQCEGGQIRMVATDTHRLAMRTAPAPSGASGLSISSIIPQRAFDTLIHSGAGPDAEVQIAIEGNRIGMEVGRDRLVATLIPGGFPAYERVVPQECNRKWTVPTEEFSAAIKRADIVAKQASHRVTFESEGQVLTLSARAEGFGTATERLEIAADGGDVRVAFNARYMLDALGVLGSEGVCVEMTEPVRPAVLKPAVDQPSFLYVIMPMSVG